MSQPIITVDQEKCLQDSLCVKDCPAGILRMNRETNFPEAYPDVSELCLDCGHCVAVCPTGALDQRVMTAADCPELKPELDISEAQVEQFLRARRSIRQYKSKEVPRAKIQRLIELARYAPTGHNTQPIHWTVISGEQDILRYSGLVVDWMRWMQEKQPEIAKAFHFDQVIKIWKKDKARILRGAPHVLVAHAKKDDPTAIASAYEVLCYLELAAPVLGLGTCWAGYFYRSASVFPPMQEALNLPDGHACFGAAMLGYPKIKYKRLPTRREPNITWR